MESILDENHRESKINYRFDSFKCVPMLKSNSKSMSKTRIYKYQRFETFTWEESNGVLRIESKWSNWWYAKKKKTKKIPGKQHYIKREGMDGQLKAFYSHTLLYSNVSSFWSQKEQLICPSKARWNLICK